MRAARCAVAALVVLAAGGACSEDDNPLDSWWCPPEWPDCNLILCHCGLCYPADPEDARPDWHIALDDGGYEADACLGEPDASVADGAGE